MARPPDRGRADLGESRPRRARTTPSESEPTAGTTRVLGPLLWWVSSDLLWEARRWAQNGRGGRGCSVRSLGPNGSQGSDCRRRDKLPVGDTHPDVCTHQSAVSGQPDRLPPRGGGGGQSRRAPRRVADGREARAGVDVTSEETPARKWWGGESMKTRPRARGILHPTAFWCRTLQGRRNEARAGVAVSRQR